MEQTYLPGDARERIIDLMKEKSMTYTYIYCPDRDDGRDPQPVPVRQNRQAQCGQCDLHCPDFSGVHRFSVGGKR